MLVHYARDTYEPSVVLMINLSPSFTKNGTLTTKPVSIVAGLDTA